MGRWAREELEDAFDKYQRAALKGAQEADWRDWADLFTPDATYFEHQYGKFWGREATGEAWCLVPGAYILRRYWPPTSNRAWVTWPSEHTLQASIITSNTLRWAIAAVCSSCSWSRTASLLRRCNSPNISIW